MKSLISIDTISPSDALQIIDGAIYHKNASKPEKNYGDKTVGVLFNHTSTRTRTSFYAGALGIGADVISYAKNELQIQTGETYLDTFKVLSGYLDLIVIRDSISNHCMKRLSDISELSVINAMSNCEHPTQALNDFSYIKNYFGTLENLKLLYVGELNSTSLALLKLSHLLRKVEITVVCPPSYESVFTAKDISYFTDGIEIVSSFEEINQKFDIIYTTKWSTTGTSKGDVFWKDKFEGLKITNDILNDYLSNSDAIFMHDLPSIRDEDTASDVLDSTKCHAIAQAHWKLYTAKASMEYCFT